MDSVKSNRREEHVHASLIPPHIEPKNISTEALENAIMGVPDQACPRCKYDLGRLLYCTPLEANEYSCPNCGLKIQAKCPKCGSWVVMIEPCCSKCGAKNIIVYKQ